jgi:hypothetical protein
MAPGGRHRRLDGPPRRQRPGRCAGLGGNGGIWRPGHCELTHEELTDRIQVAGGVACGYALDATMLLSGEIELTNGLHRWVVASELGIDVVPVKMRYETEPVWAWEPGS